MRLTSSLVRTRTHTAALLVGLSLAAPAAAQTTAGAPKSAKTAPAVDLSRIKIDNFGQISQSYYRGAQPKKNDYADLAAIGVKTLINLTSDDADANEEAMARSAGMKYVQIPMTTHAVPTAEELATFMKIAMDPASQPIYVHCVGGRHRTGVMTAVYRMTQDGWSADQAFKEMKKFKFGADYLHPEFKKFVFGYAATLANAAVPPAALAGAKTEGSRN